MENCFSDKSFEHNESSVLYSDNSLYLNKVTETKEEFTVDPSLLYLSFCLNKIIKVEIYKMTNNGQNKFSILEQHIYRSKILYYCLITITQHSFKTNLHRLTEYYILFFEVDHDIKNENMKCYINKENNKLYITKLSIGTALNLKEILKDKIMNNQLEYIQQPEQSLQIPIIIETKQQIIKKNTRKNKIITNNIVIKEPNSKYFIHYIVGIGSIIGIGYIFKHYLFKI